MEKIYKYIEDHVTPQGEALDWVEKQTHIRTNHARMLSGKLQGELLRIIVQTTGAKRILELGTFTGYYYTATFSAQIASPIVYGFIRMFAGTYMSLFYYSPIMFALAIILLLFVKHGEAIPQEVIKQIEDENND